MVDISIAVDLQIAVGNDSPVLCVFIEKVQSSNSRVHHGHAAHKAGLDIRNYELVFHEVLPIILLRFCSFASQNHKGMVDHAVILHVTLLNPLNYSVSTVN